jgi:predicted Zn-dependent protease
LHSAVPLAADAADVLLSHKPDGLETLFIADPGFSRLLLARAPALSAGHQRWLGLRPGLAVVAVVAVIAGTVSYLDLHPSQAVARVMPQPTREALGRNVVASLASNRKPCETPAGRTALDRLTQRLTAAATDRPTAVRVILLDWPLVNAFAAPGGQIILTRGLVQQARSPDEVAGVMAHELGHVLELHPETSLVRAMGLAAAAQLVFAGSSGTVSNIGLLLTQLRYTRVAEREADAHALRILKNAGISAKGLGDFFERLEQRRPAPQKTSSTYGKRLSDLELIRTHPLTAERVAAVRAQPAYPATVALADDDWRALREACGPSARPQPPAPQGPSSSGTPPVPPTAEKKGGADADRDIAEASEALGANPGDVAALQKRARAYARKGKPEDALADYTQAVQIKPDDATLHYGRGTALQSLRRHEDAVRAYDEALRLSPGLASALNNRGNAKRTLKRYDDALKDFDELIRLQPKYVYAHYNRGLVYREMERFEEAIRDFGSAIEADKGYTAAYTSRGMTHERMGARDKAIEDFRTALATPAKYNNGAWAHRTARERLRALGEATP